MCLSDKNFQVRGLMILFLIIGHAVSYGQHFPAVDVMYLTIFTFHMPMLMILSGYYSLSSLELPAWQVVRKSITSLIAPYILINIILDLIYGTFSLNIISYPSYATWFLLCLFIFKVSFRYLTRWKYGIIGLLILNIFSGLLPDNDPNYFHFIFRVFGFYFYFYLGYLIRVNDIDIRINFRSIKLYLILIGLLILNVLIYTSVDVDFSSLYYLNTSTLQNDVSVSVAIIIRLITMLTTLYMCSIVYNLGGMFASRWLQFIGKYSMYFYIFNIFATKFSRSLFPLAMVDSFSPSVFTLYSIGQILFNLVVCYLIIIIFRKELRS